LKQPTPLASTSFPYSDPPHRDPHSFPTRRSSDLIGGFTPDHATSGTSITITGLTFTGTTKVLFGTATAGFTVTNNTTLHATVPRSEEHTSELQSRGHLVCRLLHEITVLPKISSFT